VGVDRARTPATRTALLKHGADLVVDDLAELLEQEEQ
jgi:phosphoglycolate phosphatase-like HAD superfamily hydrolase